jgi:hypothetical protein
MRVAIVSFFMTNLPMAVPETQHKVVQSLLPRRRDWRVSFYQVLTFVSHAQACDEFIRDTNFDLYVMLDIDAVPLTPEALTTVIEAAAAGQLCGIIQRASHIQNGGHIYVGPAVMGVSRATLTKLGFPSFSETPRGDVGEEVTYRAQALGVPLKMFRPCKVLGPKLWPLEGDEPQFGRGTVYADERGTPIFYHNFEIRLPEMYQLFLSVCKHVFEDKTLPLAALAS